MFTTIQLTHLNFLRYGQCLFELIIVLLAVFYLEMPLPLRELMIIITIQCLIISFSFSRLRFLRFPITEIEWAIYLGLDILCLTNFFFFSGGATNPLISFFLIPLAIIAMSLSWKFSFLFVLLTVSSYSFLMHYYLPLPNVNNPLFDNFSLHIFGMWLNFVFSAIVIGYFVTDLAQSLKGQAQSLQRTREKMMRDEQIVALGTLAAGAAHELNTPLNSMKFITELLESEIESETGQEDLETLTQQIQVCQNIVRELLSSAGQAAIQAGKRQKLDHFLRSVIEKWQIIHPQADLHYVMTTTIPAPEIIADQSISQTLLNLLNNALESAPNKPLYCESFWDEHNLTITILDQGKGIDMTQAEQIGRVFFTSKAKNIPGGWGLAMSHATLERFHGQLILVPRAEGGTMTQIVLPLQTIQISQH